MVKSAIFIALLGLLHFHAASQEAPWRRDDATLISLCFDGSGRDAPQQLRALELTDIGSSTTTFELVGFTTTDRPMYEAILSHPTRFRAVVVELPGSQLAALITPPEKLASFIEGWKAVPIPTQCTASRLQPKMQFVPPITLQEPKECPAIGTNVSFRIDNGPGYSSRRVLERQRGLRVLNGLKGCNELIYKIQPNVPIKAP
jgi:hypothetical protein